MEKYYISIAIFSIFEGNKNGISPWERIPNERYNVHDALKIVAINVTFQYKLRPFQMSEKPKTFSYVIHKLMYLYEITLYEISLDVCKSYKQSRAFALVCLHV